MTDPRIAVLSALSSPGWHPVPEAHGMPWDEAEQLLAAYDASRAAPVLPAPADRAAELEEAATALDAQSCTCGCRRGAEFLRQRAAVIRASDGPSRMAGEAQQPKICELPHLTIAEEDACEQHRLNDEAQQPETQADDGPPAPLRRSWDDCPGFPEQCPNIRPVDPDPPVHYGGIRCGCADQPAVGAQQPKEA